MPRRKRTPDDPRPHVEYHDMRQFSEYLLDKIRDTEEWAIVYDMQDERWDVYVEGKSRARCRSPQEADRMMEQFIKGELL